MGSNIEINDTLQITKEQGFPQELEIQKHLKTAFTAEQFEGKIFSFSNKPDLRIFQAPPVRVFLVENKDSKWIYWGLAHILEITHDYVKKTTSGKFKVIYINSPEEMKQAYELIDQRPEFNYFGE
jgi:hypothetical protein